MFDRFLLFFTSIVIEAIPFLMFGAAAAAAIEVFDAENRLNNIFQRPVLSYSFAVFGGILFPVCECGIVSVAGKLIKKGVSPGKAAAFLVSAPIVNPFVLLSTYAAFRGNLKIVVLRAGVALLTASIMLYLFRGEEPVTGSHKTSCGCHGCSSRMHHHKHAASLLNFFSETAAEFLHMMTPFLLGAFVASIFRAIFLDTLTGVPDIQAYAAIPVSMVSAILLSVCSEADSFIIAPFLMLPLSARLAFITIGPMVDIKLLLQWRRVFSSAQVFRLAVVVPVFVWALMSLVEASGVLKGSL